MAYSPIKYAAKIAAGGLTRRQEVNRLQYARALLGDASVNWKRAKELLSPSDIRITEQLATMKQDKKIDYGTFHGKDYKTQMKKFNKLIKDNPHQRGQLEDAKRLSEYKTVFGNKAIDVGQTDRIKKAIDNVSSEKDFSSYWGY